jgi:hypothetical protein
MQTLLRWMIVFGLGGLITAANVLAVAPEHGAAYSGTGVDYMNNARSWTAEGTGAVSFRTSPSGKAVTDFRGGYSFYCGPGTATVTEQRMPISKRGRFGIRFTVANKARSGKRNGTVYVEISGAFDTDRASASVSYLVDYVFKGRHVAHPYDTSRPRRLGCASWVKGTVTTTTSSTGSPPQPRPHPQPHPNPQPQPNPQPHPTPGHPKSAATAARSRLLSF